MTVGGYLARVGAALCGVVVFGLGLRGCELVVGDWDLGPRVEVHPAIRAWDAGVRR